MVEKKEVYMYVHIFPIAYSLLSIPLIGVAIFLYSFAIGFQTDWVARVMHALDCSQQAYRDTQGPS